MNAAPGRVAVVKPCCIGDSVMALPALTSISACWPATTVEVYCGSHSKAIFENDSRVSRTFHIPDVPTWRDLLPLALRFRRGRYDRLILLDRSRYLNTAARLSSVGAIAKPAPSGSEPRHESDIYLDVVRSAGCEPTTGIPSLTPSRAACDRAAALANDIGKPFIAVQPGGAENPGTTMVSKRWPAGNFVEILRWAAGRGFATVLTGGPSDLALCQEVVASAGIGDAHVLAGSASLMESAAVVERAKLFVGVDTGMSHIAAAVGTPCVVIFGPTNPLRYCPRGEQVIILAPSGSEQIPDTDLRRQGSAHRLPSTTLITADAVIQACEELTGQTEVAAQ